MSKKILTTPIRSEDLEDIRIGDIIYLNGYLITARDCAHTRLVKHGRKIPVDLAGKAIFHAGPIMVPDQSSGSGFKVISRNSLPVSIILFSSLSHLLRFAVWKW